MIKGKNPSWCAADEPAWWEEDFAGSDITSKKKWLVVSDHGGRAVPRQLNHLGLAAEEWERHIAYDIGANMVARQMAMILRTNMVSSGFSRLVADVNRPPDDHTFARAISDTTIVPGNQGLTTDERAKRQEIAQLYHDKLRTELAANERVLISIHSFTPHLKKHWHNPAHHRPWPIAVLSHRERAYGDRFIAAFRRQHPDILLGDNQPYSGEDDWAFTIMEHGVKPKRPHLVLEFRQDLVAEESLAKAWGIRVANIIKDM